MVSASKEIAYGAAAGFLGKIIEFPFDTVKVRLQSGHNTNGTLHVITSMLRTEGFFNGFYRGIRAPLAGACVESAVLFSAYEYGQLGVKKFTNLKSDSLSAVCLSGAFSGLVASYVLTPVELVKCKLQVANLNSQFSQMSYLGTIRRIIKKDGPTGLWNGLQSTLLREIVGTAVWFASYEESLKFLQKKFPESDNATALVSGATAGFSFNLLTHPVDTIKSNIQTHDMRSSGGSKLTFKLALEGLISRPGGIRNLYNGLGITLVRSIPANAVIFYTYLWLKKNYP